MKIIWYIAAGMLFLGAVSMPSGYYDLLRFAICGAGAFAAFTNYENNNQSWAIVFGIIALIFNPFIPLYIYDKFAWLIIDLIAGILFLYNSRMLKE
jgi:hypothetical protein